MHLIKFFLTQIKFLNLSQLTQISSQFQVLVETMAMHTLQRTHQVNSTARLTLTYCSLLQIHMYATCNQNRDIEFFNIISVYQVT